jgi:hypothetical protein
MTAVFPTLRLYIVDGGIGFRFHSPEGMQQTGSHGFRRILFRIPAYNVSNEEVLCILCDLFKFAFYAMPCQANIDYHVVSQNFPEKIPQTDSQAYK